MLKDTFDHLKKKFKKLTNVEVVPENREIRI